MTSMLRKIRKRVSYVNVIATLALLFAMTGGALAAKKYLITSTKQISPKALAEIKKLAKGADGAPGAQGAAGAAGVAGAKGDSGANGSNGANGANGSNGSTGATGPKGVAGATGATGPTSATLLSGKTEMGTWSVADSGPATEIETWTPISFSLPVEKPSTEAFFIDAAETEELDEGIKPTGKGGCAGTLAAPTAPKGELCVYTEEEEFHEAKLVGIFGKAGSVGYRPAGAYIDVQIKEGSGGRASLRGDWAVTAP